MRKLVNEELNRISVDEFKNTEKNPFVLVLDNVRSLHNVGSTFRTADAFLAKKLYLGGITGTPPHREINKTALGATESVEWEHHPDVLALIKQLKGEGWTILAIEQAEGSLALDQFRPSPAGKYCFIFGNEVFGVNEEIVTLCDHCLEIPQYGTKHSLNIAVSVGIICWHYILHTKC